MFDKNDISVIYLTCFLYKNLWNPWIKNMEKYFNNINIFFCTDLILDKNYKINLNENMTLLEFEEESNMSFNGNYHKRLQYYLNNINSTYVIFYIDDMFLKQMPDFNNLLNLIDLMKSNNNIIYSKLSHSSELYSKNIIEYNKYEYKIGDNINEKYLINIQPSIFEKNFFIDYVNHCFNVNTSRQGNSSLEVFAGGIEKHLNYFINKPNYICLRPIKEIINIYGCGGLVAAGMLSINKDILKQNDIYIETYKNNLIYELNEDVIKNIGDGNIHKLTQNNIL